MPREGKVVCGVVIPSPKICNKGSTVTSAFDLDKKTLMMYSAAGASGPVSFCEMSGLSLVSKQ